VMSMTNLLNPVARRGQVALAHRMDASRRAVYLGAQAGLQRDS
jgi:hypothetical protein